MSTKIWDGGEELQYTVNINQSPWSAPARLCGRRVILMAPHCHMPYTQYYQIFATYIYMAYIICIYGIYNMHFQNYKWRSWYSLVMADFVVGNSENGWSEIIICKQLTLLYSDI